MERLVLQRYAKFGRALPRRRMTEGEAEAGASAQARAPALQRYRKGYSLDYFSRITNAIPVWRVCVSDRLIAVTPSAAAIVCATP